MRTRRGMTLVVKTVTALVSGFILLYGVSVALYGHTSPGGGFAGGVTVASCLILMLLAFGRDFVARVVRDRVLVALASAGALLFLAVALLGYSRGSFFQNFLAREASPAAMERGLFHAGIVLLCDVAIGLLVAAHVFGVVLALAAFRAGNTSRKD